MMMVNDFYLILKFKMNNWEQEVVNLAKELDIDLNGKNEDI